VLLIPGIPGMPSGTGCAFGAPGEALRTSGGTLAALDPAPPRIRIDSPVRTGDLARIVFDAPGKQAFALLATTGTARLGDAAALALLAAGP
jgi:hypothetical protein